MSFRIIWKKFATIATLGTNQDPTLHIYYNQMELKNQSYLLAFSPEILGQSKIEKVQPPLKSESYQ